VPQRSPSGSSDLDEIRGSIHGTWAHTLVQEPAVSPPVHAINHVGNTQPPLSASRLWYPHAPDVSGTVAPIQQARSQLRQKLLQVLAHVLDALPVRPGRSLIRRHFLERLFETFDHLGMTQQVRCASAWAFDPRSTDGAGDDHRDRSVRPQSAEGSARAEKQDLGVGVVDYFETSALVESYYNTSELDRQLCIKVFSALNTGFSEWPSFLKNERLTAALIDRLTENSYVINMKGCVA
jgi:hypothetical protein